MKKFLVFTALWLCVTSVLFAQNYPVSSQVMYADSLQTSCGPVNFSWNFSSGSIGVVRMVDSVWVRPSARDSVLHLSYEIASRYDPHNPVDTSLAPSPRWFYFKMKGVEGKHIYLSFLHTDPLRAVYSLNGYEFQRFEHYEASMRQVSARFDQDEVYIAYCMPYDWDYLQQRIKDWQTSSDFSPRPLMKVDTIGRSHWGLPIQMLTITDPSVDNSGKNRIWIHARIHPSESPSSWYLDGMLSSLLSGTPKAAACLKEAVFYVVPFINPDGVHGGFSRSNALGINQEINWNRPDSLTSVEIYSVRATMENLLKEGAFDLLLNLHSQVDNRFSIYIHTAESTTAKYFSQETLLSQLNVAACDQHFANDNVFSTPAPRYVEGWMWNHYPGRCVSLTLETPYTYFNRNPEGKWASPEVYKSMGESLLTAVGDFFQWNVPGRRICDSPKVGAKWEVYSQADMVFFGQDYYLSRKRNARLVYRWENLPSGMYEVYRWKCGQAVEVSAKDENTWQMVDVVEQKKTGLFRYVLRSKEAGETADALLLVKK